MKWSGNLPSWIELVDVKFFDKERPPVQAWKMKQSNVYELINSEAQLGKLHSAQPMLHHNDPLLKAGKVAGYVASGAYAAGQAAAIGTCSVNTDDRASIFSGVYSVMVEGRAIPATVSLAPFSKPQTTG